MLKTCISLSSLQVKHGHSKLVWCALIGKTFYYYRNHEDKVIPLPLLFLNPSFPFLMMLFSLLLLLCLMLRTLPWLYFSPSNNICSAKRINIFSDFFFNYLKLKWLKRQVTALSQVTVYLVSHFLHLVLWSLQSRLLYRSWYNLHTVTKISSNNNMGRGR